MASLESVLAARALLKTLTPLKTDCGRLCAGACCQPDEEGLNGMLLFPGEEALYEDCDFAKVIPAEFDLAGERAQLLVCEGRCDRDSRPLACRLFPLYLRFLRSGKTKVKMDPRAASVCPLTDYGVEALSSAFVDAARQAYDRLLEDEACARYLRELDEAFRL